MFNIILITNIYHTGVWIKPVLFWFLLLTQNTSVLSDFDYRIRELILWKLINDLESWFYVYLLISSRVDYMDIDYRVIELILWILINELESWLYGYSL